MYPIQLQEFLQLNCSLREHLARTQISLVKPCLQRKVENSQVASKKHHDGEKPKMRSFDLNQRVKVRNVRGGKEKWIPGVIVAVKGPLTYLVKVPGNSRRFVHADHIIPDDSIVRLNGHLPRDEPLTTRDLNQG